MLPPSTRMQDQVRFVNRPWRAPAAVILLLLLGLVSFAGVILIFPVLIGQSSRLEVALHSSLFADYRADLAPLQIPPAGMDLIEDLIKGQHPEQAPGRIATLVNGLLTPVPTATGFPGQVILLPLKTPTATNTIEPVYSPPTKAAVPSLFPTPTVILVKTAIPTRTATSRPTDIIPTKTPTRQSPVILVTQTPNREATAAIPTLRPTFAPTYPPIPTGTSTPRPTATPGPYLPPATPYP